MDRKKSLKDILEICKDGKFNKTLTLVKSSNKEIDNKCAVSIIVSCCNACVNNGSSPENILEDDLYELLEFVISSIKYLYESELLSYLQSIFFILKTLGVKKCYDVIAKMESMLVPSFLPLDLPTKHKTTYQSSASLLHNLVITVGTEKDNRYNEALLAISYIVSRIYSKLSNPSSLLSISYNCGTTLSTINVSSKRQEEYYFYVLDLLKMEELTSITQEDFKCLIKYFTLVLNNILQRFDFEHAASFYEKAFGIGTKIFQKEEHVHVLTLLRFPLILSPLIFNEKMESFIKCKRSLQKLDSTSSEQLGNRLNILIYTVVSYYKSTNNRTWCDFTDKFQLDLLQFVYSLGQFEAQIKLPCPCKCLNGKNTYQIFSYSQYICTLLEITVRLQSRVTPDYHEKSANLLIKFCDDVQTLKTYDCDKWKGAWNILGMGMYNIGVHLYQKLNRASLFYFYNLIKYFIKLEGKSGKVILKFSIVSSAFTAVCSLNACDYKNCMAYTALATLFCQNQRDTLMSHWIKAKVGQRDLKTPDCEEVQKITLVSVLITDKIDLLIFELEQYKKKWKSKVPMMSALKQLYDMADLNTIVQVVVKVFGDCDLFLHDEVPKLIHRILKQYEAKVSGKENYQSETTVFLAVLYHLHYKYCVKDTITKNTDDMERTMIMAQKSSEPPDAIPRDPNEECDIVSSYECLRLNRYFCVMKYLNKSLSLLSLYRLHNHRVRGAQALQMALKLAQLDDKPAHIIQTIGFIVESSDVTRSYMKYLILLADRQLGNIACTDLTNLKIILTYYICKARAYLYRDYKEAYRIFQMARDLYEVQDDKNELMIIKCQLLMLHYKFVMLPCRLEIEDHKKNTLLTIHSANVAVYEVYNKSKLDGPYDMSVLLDANEQLTKLYHSLRVPREVRAYCRETIILTQKLVLPLRCASYLMYLSHADLRSTRYEDFQIKLDGLADILCLTKRNLQIDRENKPPAVTKFEKEIDGITNDIQEMVLDLPAPNNYKKQYCPSSPTLVIEPFHLPAFITHDDSCDCFYCTCLEYQELVLQKIRLDALINIKQSNVVIATDFFHGALELYERCCRKSESYTETIVKLISYDLIPDVKNELMEAYGQILLDYSYHIMRTKSKTEALNITNKLIDLISSNKMEHAYLYSEALVQKLGYIAVVPRAVSKLEGQSDLETLGEQSDMDTLCPPQPVYLPTTPESKQSKVTFSTEYTPAFTPKKTVVKKCLPFNLSPSQENDSDDKKSSPMCKKMPKTPAPKIKMYANEDNSLKAKTPATKIQIYTSTALPKRTNKKRNQVNVNNAFIASDASNTPAVVCPVKIESGLKSRTKLLTERLRQSTKTSDAPASVNDENVVQNGKKNTSVRKNLLSELTGSENEQNGGHGAIRKSTRNRK
ncbi:hypothetical protein NQ314_008315 [Rhamnusium bicolor]|uniref:Uncharacterized protein n=1 Tax=Rhamnusium bicolor TaxID=1586634 RepID=A0AAV8YBC7_9CUCU|nr:hypothetical protein NQ314_008315 [Rhamnusium bicolor]